MAKKIAINGFGRIGRVILRIIESRRRLNKSLIEVLAINDLAKSDDMAHLFKYDSVHGRFFGEVNHSEKEIFINQEKIKIFNERDPEILPWRDLDIDLVVESTGVFLDRAGLNKHLKAGAKKVLVTAPAKEGGADATICYGVNHEIYNDKMNIISTASCTTNCTAPIAKIMDETIGIKKASVTTVHSYTNDQVLLDLAHKDRRRSRAAALSMIPTTTGAAQAIALVLPKLKGKFEGIAIRVPTPNVSLIDMALVANKNTNKEEINSILKEASISKFAGIMDYCEEPLVSIDMNGTTCSSIIDSLSTMVVDGDLVKILSWYDNEWGFANRAVDLIEMI